MQFGFTGTPIFPQNALRAETTASVFGQELHSYVITDAIRDEKVLKFKVDYNNVRPQFKSFEIEQDEAKLNAAENKSALLHANRIREITQYILNNFRQKTHRLYLGNNGFNAMFAVSSVAAAKLYYESFKNLQKGSDNALRVATIFSFAPNEEQDVIGDIQDESFEVLGMNKSGKEFLTAVIADYNECFKTNFSLDNNGFQNYYRDLASKVRDREIDLLIVVGMFLTGFDAPKLNTLFVDKNLRYHGLIQAYSRTNRISDATKTFGNIVTFRDLQQATIDALTLFGDKNTKNMVIEKSYKEWMEGFTDVLTGKVERGFVNIVKELEQKFPAPAAIKKESDKKEFIKLFGEYLRSENVLQNYDEFTSLKAWQTVDINNNQQVDDFKAKHNLNDNDITTLKTIIVPTERKMQDYRSTYNDIREWFLRRQSGEEKPKSTIDWNDVEFEIELLKSQEVNLEYILELVFNYKKTVINKADLVDEIRRVIRASINNRAKESLFVGFINQTDLNLIEDKASMIEAFYTYAQAEKIREAEKLIEAEGLNAEEAKRYITNSLKRGLASDGGDKLDAVIPGISPLNPQYLTKKRIIFKKLYDFVEKFKGVGGQL